MNPMARWGDRGKYEGKDVDSIGEPGLEEYKGLNTPLKVVIVRKKLDKCHQAKDRQQQK